MSLLDRLMGTRSLEDPKVPISSPTIMDLIGERPTNSGKSVTPETAMQLSAVYACVGLIAETFASLPAIVYRRLQRGKERATDHPLYPVLHDIPNPEITSFDLLSTMQAHILLWGHCYAEIVRDGAGRVRELWPILPQRVSQGRNSQHDLIYIVTPPDGDQYRIRANRMLHVSALMGLSPIQKARESIGMALAAEEYGGRFFSNDSRPGGILEHPQKLSTEAADRLRMNFEAANAGLSNRHRMMILEEGMKWQQVGLAPQDSQFLESRRFQVSEIARLFRVPPHMIGEVSGSTSWGTGIEQQTIGFITYSLRSWLVRWEKELNKMLLTHEEKENYFIEFLVAGLLRGDQASRYQAYAIGRQNGWLSGNDIRELENMNPVNGLDEYLVNGNMMPAAQAGSQMEAGDEN